jgi:AbrB family looped-hinge helix DNA binding protein
MVRSGIINSKGQITLPKELRDRHHLHEGEVVVFLDSIDGILLKHGKTRPRGALKGKLDLRNFESELARLRKEWIA